jgi:hypothetical protein
MPAAVPAHGEVGEVPKMEVPVVSSVLHIKTYLTI